MVARGARLDPDLNRYDAEHVTADHPLMSAEQWQSIYDHAWHLYYSPEHIETLIKRSMGARINPARLTSMIFTFYASHAFERVHPLQSGAFRRKRRLDRRSGMPRENPLVFYPRRIKEIFSTYVPALLFLWQLTRTRHRLEKDPANRHYRDIATTPLEDELTDKLALYEATDGARKAANRARLRAAAIHS